VRIWRKVERKDKTESRLAEAMLVSEKEYIANYDDIDSLSRVIRFKMNRLNEGKINGFLSESEYRPLVLPSCSLPGAIYRV
jgi:hypothetical protein